MVISLYWESCVLSYLLNRLDSFIHSFIPFMCKASKWLTWINVRRRRRTAHARQCRWVGRPMFCAVFDIGGTAAGG